MATVGLVPPALALQLTGGLTKEMDKRLKTVGGDAQCRNPEFIKLVLLDMLREAGAKVLFYTLATDAIVEGHQLKGVIVESKGGPKAILAKVVVDSTGDADIAAYAGVPFEMGRGRDTETQCVTLMFLLGNVDTARRVQVPPRQGRPRRRLPPGPKRRRPEECPQRGGRPSACLVVSGEHGAINVNRITSRP